MPNITAVNQNACEWQIKGELDISAAAAVVALRGDNMTPLKTATGTYTVTIKNAGALQLVQLLNRHANYTATVPATALGVRVSTVTQNATSGDIVITLVTTALPTSGAATDGTAATTIAFQVVIRICQFDSVI